MFLSTTRLLSVCAAAGLAVTGQTAFSQNLLSNGNFSINDGAAKVDFTTTASNGAASTANPIPYWGLTTTVTGVSVDTGIQSGLGPGGTGYAAFEQYNATGNAGTAAGSIFNLTSTAVTAGTTYTLTFVGEDTSGTMASTDPVGVTFFSQAGGPSAAYTFAGTALQTSSVTLGNKNVTAYPSYSVSFTAPTTTGGDIGIELTNTSTGDYNQIDNFVLTAGVPEPSTYALMAAGLMGLVFLRRRARA